MNEQTLEIAFKKGFVKCAMEKYAFGVQDINNFLTDHNIDPQWAGAGVGAVGGGLLGGLLGPKGHTGKSMLLGALGGGFGGYYGGGKFQEYMHDHPYAHSGQMNGPFQPLASGGVADQVMNGPSGYQQAMRGLSQPFDDGSPLREPEGVRHGPTHTNNTLNNGGAGGMIKGIPQSPNEQPVGLPSVPMEQQLRGFRPGVDGNSNTIGGMVTNKQPPVGMGGWLKSKFQHVLDKPQPGNTRPLQPGYPKPAVP